MLERCKYLRDDHLRYMQKWGLIQPAQRGSGEVSYAFADIAVIRQADAELAEGARFRAVMRNLLASRVGQLAFDFRLDAEPAKVLQLKRPIRRRSPRSWMPRRAARRDPPSTNSSPPRPSTMATRDTSTKR
jgi:hypothetical protein